MTRCAWSSASRAVDELRAVRGCSTTTPSSALHRVQTSQALNPFFQISSLRTFNAKFAPRWLARDRGRGHRDLAKVGVLYAAAEGFLDVPVIGPLLTPKPA